MHPKNTDARPEKLKRKLLIQMPTETDGWTGNTICPFHHSLNGRGMKKHFIKSYVVLLGNGTSKDSR